MNGVESRWNALRAVVKASRDDALTASPHAGPARASSAQERLWFLQQLDPASTAYNLAVATRLVGPLDIAALERALVSVLARHDVLRATLRMEHAGLVQVAGAGEVALELVHVDAASIDEWAASVADRPFDLERGPLLRARLAKLGDGDHCLVLVVHHCVFDAWSFELLMRELCSLYDSQSVAEVDYQYADYAAWERARMVGERGERALAYWTRHLDNELPVLHLPNDGQASKVAASADLQLPAELVAALKQLAAREGTTLYVVLLATFTTLLHRYSGANDVIVGTPIANRTRRELEHVIGCFTNTLAVRMNLDGEPSFVELLRRAGDSVNGAIAHQDMPLERVVSAVRSRMPEPSLFRVMFAFQNVPKSRWRWSSLDATAWNIPARSPKVDLALTMQELPGGAKGLVEYDTGLFAATSIERMLRHFRTLLEEVARAPERRIGELPLVDAEERDQLLTAWNQTRAPYPRDATIHELFAAVTVQQPDAIALVAGDETLTYGELSRRAHQLAHHLAAHGLGEAPRIAICLDRSAPFVVAALAILELGGAYVPIDASAPSVRRALPHVQAVVTDDARAVWLGPLSVPVVHVGDPQVGEQSVAPLPAAARADSVAYVLFTSGSTGTPRGVLVPHRGVVRLVRGQSYARFGPDEVVLQIAPLVFDASTFEIWGALLNGAKLVIAPPGLLSISELVRSMSRHGVTTAWLPSGLFELLVDAGEVPRSLKQLLTGGDVMSVAHAKRFRERAPECRLVNGYGPTECSTFATAYAVDTVAGSIPIGPPIANTTVYVLDRYLEPVPLGVVGEAFIGGDGVALGYLGDDEATQARFSASPFVPGDTLYRTGDLVRRRADGNLEFVGRADSQTKIRGVRVEPGELEAALCAHAGVKRATVIVDDTARKRLVAFVVPRGGGLEEQELRAHVRARVMPYLVPDRVEIVDRIPLTTNGKPDRSALRAPLRRDAGEAPRDTVEWTVAQHVAAVLGIETIGRDESFFDAGGDSLRVVELVARLERAGYGVPLATFFEQPTVAQIANVLSAAETSSLHATLLRAGRGGRPLFLVPGGRARTIEAMLCAKLVSRLRDDVPVFGVLAPLCGGPLEQIARRCVETLQHLQPRGPYRIGGQCSGGVLAYEIAQQLQARDEHVEQLLLIDSWCPSTAGALYERVINRPRSLLKAGWSFVRAIPQRADDAEPWLLDLWQRAVIPRAEREHMRAWLRYRPARYRGRITLLASEDSLRRGITAPWQLLASNGVAVHRMRGDHESYYKQYADDAADALRDCLEAHP